MHYRISSAIGVGGMGEVFRAADTKLGRDVALKVLPADVAGDAERLMRFRREARAVATLNHPNIVTLYSVEECDGIHFLTMELIEGQPLDRLISSNGLPAERIIEIAGAIAEALAAAHEKGIVHRDLKPANVMVTKESRVKVLDFGLAKDVGADAGGDATLTSAGRTQAGMVMGTPAYMSPEQVSGQMLDHRTDIFSFGVLLHEMATGRRPFEGKSSAELISAILRDTPAPVTEARPDLPADLSRVIRRCLEKDPRYRVQTARDVANEFREMARSGTQTTPITTPSAHRAVAMDSSASRIDEGFWVAVLPFKHSGSNPDLLALADGLTEDIVTNMSKFSYLRVIARSSTARYANQTPDVRTAAKELGARYVMEGGIRQAGPKIRIAAQLVDANTGAGLWAEAYDRTFTPEKMLEVLDDVVPRIVATVGDTQGVLAHNMTEALRSRDPESFTPYEALLRSFGFHQHVNAAEHLAGRAALEKAVKVAPDRADCWAMLSWLYRAEHTQGFNVRPDAMDRSLAAAQRAVALAPSSHLAQAALASAFFFRRDFGSFRPAADRAVALNSMEGYITAFLGLHFAYAGDWEKGCALAELATRLNPNHPGWYWLPLAMNAYRQRDSRRALEYAQKVNMPGLWTAQTVLTAILSQHGETDRARAALRGLLELRPDFASVAREELGKWWLPDMVEQLLGDLQRAGLDVAHTAATPQRSASSISTRTASGEARAAEGFWVAVLPFRYTGNNAELKGLAEGLSEEIITGLARFTYLRVIARGSSAKHASESGDVRAIGKELGARYVMEGSLRQAGNKLRVAVQLVDTVSGAHLWAETYERAFQPESVFELQDDLVPRIVSTVADQYGILPRSMSEVLRSKSADQLTPHEAVLCTFTYFSRLTPEEHRAVRDILERAVKVVPDHADCWAMLSMIYRGEFAQGFNPSPNPLDRALAAAQRAVDLAPTHALGHYALATVHFFRKETVSFQVEAAKAMSLNPLDASVKAYLGLLIAASGEWDRGCRIVDAAMELNPNCPGYFYFAGCCSAYRQGKYAESLEAAARVNMPNYFHVPALRAAALGQLGRYDEAQKAAQEVLALRPNFASSARQEYAKWYAPDLIEHILDGLRKAGLEIPDDPSGSSPQPKTDIVTGSGVARAAEGFWVAVLPFRYAGSNADLKALAEGLSEEIITGLARFTYLRVIARGSSAKYASESGDVRAIGKELGARYVMEGSLRQAANKLRVAVQLVDAVTGAHLWAENFERPFDSEALFELQDDLVPRIVSTVADAHGILPHTMSEGIRGKTVEQLTPYEAVLRGFSYAERVSPEEHLVARDALERAVQLAPTYAYAWAMLSLTIIPEYAFGYNPKPNPLERALDAARRAVELDSSGHRGYQALAQSHFYGRDMQAFRTAAERALVLNPLDGCNVAQMGSYIAYAGEWERGCALVERALRLNPNHPGWYWFPLFFNAYRNRDYNGALAYALKINLPHFHSTHMALAAAYGQLGQLEEGRREVQELLRLNPDVGRLARPGLKAFSPELAEHVIEGLRKAGLDIPS